MYVENGKVKPFNESAAPEQAKEDHELLAAIDNEDMALTERLLREQGYLRGREFDFESGDEVLDFLYDYLKPA